MASDGARFPNAMRGALDAPRRVALVTMAPDRLLAWLASGGRLRPVVPGLPADAELENVAYDFMRHSLVLAVSHDSFDEVQPGDYPPRLPLRVDLVECDDDE